MRVVADKDQWYEKAACKGSGPWVFADVPAPVTADKLLSICEGCPVRRGCAQDLVDTGDKYPYQVRAGLRLWTDDVDQLPDVIHLRYVAPKKGPGRPRGPLSAMHVKPQGGKFNPHTRGEWNV